MTVIGYVGFLFVGLSTALALYIGLSKAQII